MQRRPYGLSSYRKARQAMLASRPRCAHCPRRATTADHQPPLSRHFHREGTGCCQLVPSCKVCMWHQGGRLVHARSPEAPAGEPDPDGFDVDSVVWDVRWLDDLREVPEDGWWPRLMTLPHPLARGSLGGEFTEWCRVTHKLRLHWWQRLAATRLLEVDGEGELVWRTAFLSVARQSGKSTLVSMFADWRTGQAERFGEVQLVMHTADTLAHASDVQKLMRVSAEARGFLVRRGKGDEEIVKPTGAWLVRAQGSTMGSSVSLGIVDEGQGVSLTSVTENLTPALVEKRQSQLLLLSTAHSDCTELMPLYRVDALGELVDGERLLMLEWSASAGSPIGDVIAARQASPHWSARRAGDVAAAARQALALPVGHKVRAGFVCQWFNQWPAIGSRGPGVALVDAEAWAACEGALGSSVAGFVAMEANLYGDGAGVAMAVGDGEGCFEVDGVVVDGWDDAWVWVRKFLEARPGSRLLLGAHLETSIPTDLARHRKVTNTEARAGLVVLRQLVGERRVLHDATVALDAQVASARVKPAETGLRLVGAQRCDLLKAAVWALWYAQQAPPLPGVN